MRFQARRARAAPGPALHPAGPAREGDERGTSGAAGAGSGRQLGGTKGHRNHSCSILLCRRSSFTKRKAVCGPAEMPQAES
mmetsp:Transcript_20915/g.66709  ORF Transcript_20915/g.66709 Transcript_20915/m.66709 type:complete len:81 (-) Transcript_20915:413-655(-)